MTTSEPDPNNLPEENEGGTLTLVCVTCGEEYYFGDDPPEDLTCEQCGSRVFRSFYTPEDGDEAAEDFRDSTERGMDTDEPSPETGRGDLSDLRRL